MYLHPFEAAVRAGVSSVMNAYNEVDGVPCAADRELLTTLCATRGASRAVSSPTTSPSGSSPTTTGSPWTPARPPRRPSRPGSTSSSRAPTATARRSCGAVRAGRVDEATIDTAVRRVLLTKFELGLFEQPYVSSPEAAATSNTRDQRALARTLARKSLVLLRNDGTLPLRPDVGSVAVIGPSADEARNLFGDYAYPAHVESLRDPPGQRATRSGTARATDRPSGARPSRHLRARRAARAARRGV